MQDEEHTHARTAVNTFLNQTQGKSLTQKQRNTTVSHARLQ